MNDGNVHAVSMLFLDNGKEFLGYQEIAEALDAEWYFSHLYSSWEQSANEMPIVC